MSHKALFCFLPKKVAKKKGKGREGLLNIMKSSWKYCAILICYLGLYNNVVKVGSSALSGKMLLEKK